MEFCFKIKTIKLLIQLFQKTLIFIETAFIASQNVQIGANVYIGPNVNVLEDVMIGDNCKIFSGTTLGCAFIHKRVDNSVIGNFHDGKLIIKNNVPLKLFSRQRKLSQW